MGSIWFSHLADIVCWEVGPSHRLRGLTFLPAYPESGMVLMGSKAFGQMFSLRSFPIVAPWQNPDGESGSSLVEGIESSEAGHSGVCV